jgi:hypothetical protein
LEKENGEKASKGPQKKAKGRGKKGHGSLEKNE